METDVKPLTREEQIELSDKARAGCVASRNELICSIIPYLKTVAAGDEDLFHEFIVNLISRTKTFDARRAAFITYATTSVLWLKRKLLRKKRRLTNIFENEEVDVIQKEPGFTFPILRTDSLSDTEQELLELRRKGLTLVEMGKRLGHSKSRIHQRLNLIISKLREANETLAEVNT